MSGSRVDPESPGHRTLVKPASPAHDGGTMEELLDIVDTFDRIVGQASRGAVHGNPRLIHRAVHVLVFDSRGRLYLQKRSMTKDIQPGKWDTSVGGHVASGETFLPAAVREMEEELAIRNKAPVCLYAYTFRNEIETENVRTFRVVYDGPVCPYPDEISEGRFWADGEINAHLGSDLFTPNFELEIEKYRAWAVERGA